MAWLNAVPKPDPAGQGTAQGDHTPEPSSASRLDRLKADKIPILMPPNPAPEVVARLTEIGMTEAAGMGAAPLSWLTLDAWQRVTGITLSTWEARLLRHLSVEYLAESRKAESDTCPPPWKAPVTQRQRDVELARIKATFGIK